jgi:1,5-anhydro-D-fructose reductase (1,5-anhydro-D-mannitol-forming)
MIMTVRWGIIGCGDVCEVKSGPPLYKVPGSELRIVMRRNEALARDFAERHRVSDYTTSARDVIEHPDVDAVYVATPPGSHLEYALQVAAAGKPCYVEKPMARNATECERMVAAFRRAKQPLFVAYYRRALPRFTETKRLIESGGLGRLMAVQYLYQGERRHRPGGAARPTSWREDAAVAGGGLFLDLGSHVLDLLDFLLGPLEQVSGHAAHLSNPTPLSAGTVEDSVSLSFVSGGVPGTCALAFHTTRFQDQLTLIGSGGTLTLSVFGKEPLTLFTTAGTQSVPVPHPEHVQYPLMETIVSELSCGALRCPSTGETALRTNRVMDQALSAYYRGRADAFWERAHSWP